METPAAGGGGGGGGRGGVEEGLRERSGEKRREAERRRPRTCDEPVKGKELRRVGVGGRQEEERRHGWLGSNAGQWTYCFGTEDGPGGSSGCGCF
jgi:hypothetical protein